MMKFLYLFIIASLLLLSSCKSTQNMGSNQTTGTVVGAVGGGLIGSQIGGGTGRIVATGVGVAAGALIGGEIGARLDDQQRYTYVDAYGRTMTQPTGQREFWGSPGYATYGTQGTITTTSDPYWERQRYCRIATTEVYQNGERQVFRTKSCQRPNGSWETMNSN